MSDDELTPVTASPAIVSQADAHLPVDVKEARRLARKASDKRYYQARKQRVVADDVKEARKAAAQKAYAKRYRAANKQRIRDHDKRYYAANKAKVAAQAKRYYEANKSSYIARAGRWNQEHKGQRALIAKRYYAANKDAFAAAGKAALEHHRDRCVEARQRLGGKCVQCGHADWRALQFDHIDPTTKKYDISSMRATSDEVFWAEIETVQLLCANCHRQKTYRENASAETEPRRQAHRERVARAKERRGGRCVDCDYGSDQRVLHFVHRLDEENLAKVSHMEYADDATFELEVERCDLRCARCQQIAMFHTENADHFKRKRHRDTDDSPADSDGDPADDGDDSPADSDDDSADDGDGDAAEE